MKESAATDRLKLAQVLAEHTGYAIADVRQSVDHYNDWPNNYKQPFIWRGLGVLYGLKHHF